MINVFHKRRYFLVISLLLLALFVTLTRIQSNKNVDWTYPGKRPWDGWYSGSFLNVPHKDPCFPSGPATAVVQADRFGLVWPIEGPPAITSGTVSEHGAIRTRGLGVGDIRSAYIDYINVDGVIKGDHIEAIIFGPSCENKLILQHDAE